MLGQRRKRWAKFGPALGQGLVFAGRHICVLHITRCEAIKTVAQLIELKDSARFQEKQTLRGKML